MSGPISQTIIVKSTCVVCGAEKARFRYGARSCGACALFFRRFMNSSKIENICKCGVKGTNRLCRLCRMSKCLRAGMKACRVTLPPVDLEDKVSRSSYFLPPIRDVIVERSWDRLKSVDVAYNMLNSQRAYFKEVNCNSATMTLHDLTCLVVSDFNKVKKSFQSLHGELRTLSDFEKDAIFTNFFTGFSFFEFAVLAEGVASCVDSSIKMSIGRFYNRSNEKFNLSENDLSRIFIPYLEYFDNVFKKTIVNLKLDGIEIGFILSLRLLDSGISNISEKTMELCRALRTVVLRELRSYYIEFGIEEKRFYDVLEVLPLIEKVDMKFHQKFLLCDSYGIKMDEEYRRIRSVANL